MRHLVIGQRKIAHKFLAFHWSPHCFLITIGQHFVTTRVVHLPTRTESLITESDQGRANHYSYCSHARSAQPGAIRTRLCGPCIAAKAAYYFNFTFNIQTNTYSTSLGIPLLSPPYPSLIGKRYSFTARLTEFSSSQLAEARIRPATFCTITSALSTQPRRKF